MAARPLLTHPLRSRRGALAVTVGAVLALLVTAGLAGPAASAAPAPQMAPTVVGKVAWAPCYQWLTRGIAAEEGRTVAYQCAQIQVPLDYDRPGVASVQIALVRIPASDPSRRIGSLFLNPGGPGGSGVDFAAFAGPYLYTDEVRARFDIVGFDPRGVGRSTALTCAGSFRQMQPWFVSTPWPETAPEVAAWAGSDAALQSACAQKGGRMLDHMSTADVARDLDRLRAAVGDAALSYAGYSYGSYLGTTYANLFPGRVRALVVDGVLDPVDWSTGDPGEGALPFSTRLRSDIGARDTLGEFFRLCDTAPSGCPFAGPAGSAARYDVLEARLRSQPIVFPDGFTYDERFLVADTLSAMYGSFDWWYFADYLAFLEGVAQGTVPLSAPAFESKRRSVGSGRGGFPHYPGFEWFAGVACADSDNPDTVAAWQAAAEARLNESRFGPLWTWVSSVCSAWPGTQDDRYTGPWTAATARPVLVVNARFDPATPLHGADRVAALLPGARQLTVQGWGHTTPFLSAAADAAVGRYLVDGTLPAVGAVFHQDFDPFTPPPDAVTAERAALRASFERAAFDGLPPKR